MPSELAAGIRRYAGHQPLGTLLIAGTAAAELDDLLALSPARLLVLEPDSDLWPALEETARRGRIELWKGAPAAAAGEAPFHKFNVPRLSSLHPPSEALLRLFPGLRQTGAAAVPTFPLVSLVEQASLDGDALNVLIIEIPGIEDCVFRVLAEPPLQGLFPLVALRTTAEAFYEGAPAPREALQRLQRQGYRLEAVEEADPDFPLAWLRLDPLALEARQLREELEGERRRSAELERDKARQEAERQAAQEKARALTAEGEALRRRLEELEERAAALDRDGKRDKETLREQRAELQAHSEAVSLLRERLARLEDELAQERGLRERIEAEFTRAQAQMDLLREFLDLRPARRAQPLTVPALVPDDRDPS